MGSIILLATYIILDIYCKYVNQSYYDINILHTCPVKNLKDLIYLMLFSKKKRGREGWRSENVHTIL